MDNKMDIAFPKKNVQDIELSHSIEVDSFTGSTSIDVPLFFTKGRSGFTPDFSLHYSSSGKNSVFGKGWDLSGVSTISISTKHHFPRYDNTDEYVFNGNSDLVPVLENESGKQVRKIRENEDFLIEHYQLKLDNLYTRFEKWIEKSTMHTHWKVRETNGIVSVYGRNNTGVSRIFDQENPSKIFGWLLEAKYASDGNAILFEYKAEDYEQVERLSSNEIHRTMQKLNSAQRYLKRIYYGNPIPLRPDSELSAESEWFYQIIFDFGEHLLDPLSCYPESNAWNCRTDAFSSYYTGFEIRTYRLCRRILVFHNISSLREDSPQLIGCYELKYSEEPTGNQLNNILFTGFRYHSDLSELEQRSLPPLRFSYSQPELGDGFVNAVQDVFENFPGGFNEANSRWIDLYGDGVPGILTETDSAWYYKPNLGNGNFEKQHKVANKPSSSKGIYGISDFDGNGNQHLVVFEGRNAGYFEFNRDLDSWNEYKTFPVSPHIDHNKNVQFIDLSGNGSADIIVSKQDSFIYYPSKGKEGFGSPVEYAKPKSNGTSKVLMVGDKPANNHFLADMTGDGLLDQVFVSKGRIEYWPNMGNGVFGDGVLMENSPAFDFTYEFDMKRLRFADITGNGISDLIYIGRGKIFCWINFFGNKFLDPRIIDNIPYIDNISTVNILDFLGNGTPQLLWSSSLPGDMGNSIRYIQLMKGIKPNLLVSVDNSKGKKTYLKYTLSSKSYLDDKLKGRPWISRLPRHRIVVEKIEVHDLINQSRYVSSYKYHDGFFDSREKEFRGFGMVEQYDTESFESLEGIAVDEYSLPKCTRIWYHNGLPGWNEKRKKQYYNGDTYQPLLPECIIEDLSQLKGFEYEDAFLCLSGQKIREEVYTVGSDGNRFPHPIRVSQVNYGIRRIQPAINDVKARFDWYQQESLEINYEQAPFDPRINHQVNLNFDAYGNIQKVCTVGYPRRTAVSGRLLAQEKCHISSSLMSYINFNQENRYETGILYEHKTYEIGGLYPSENHIFSLTELRTEIESALLSPLDYNIPFDELADEAQAALRDWKRMFYWDTPSGSVLPLGSAGNVILVHHSEMACFTPAMIDELFAEKINSGILETRAHYNFHDGYWWKSEAVQHFLPAEAFYLVNYIENPDGGIVSFTYDEPYFMNIVRIQDSMGNRTSSEIDYHLNAPYRITDPNENITEVLYDPLGMILLSTSYGTILSDDGSSSAYGNRPLAAYIPVGDTDFNSILESPSAYLQHAGEYFYYDLESWERDEIPLRIIVLSREDYVDKGNGMLSENNRIQAAINYYDGFGREMQTKTRIEPGMVVRRDESGLVVIGPDDLPEEEFSEERWLVSGNKVYNNKQLLVKQYEPFFSGNPAFESDDELRMYGVSTHLFYDVEGRLLRQNMPNGSYAKTEISPWEVLAYDENDTIEDSIYRMKREALLNTHPEKMSLNRTLSHSNTPTISQIDPLGREIRTIQTAQVESENRITENYLDYYGNIVKIIDPRGLEAFVNVYDMTGQKLYEQSIDSGTRLIFPDGLNRPLFLWDGKGICTSYTFDLLGRPVSLTVEEPSGAVITTERYEYGESLSEPGPINARGNLVNYYDQAGIQTFKQYTPYRNPIEVNRQLTLDYKNIPDWTQVDLVEMDTEVYITQNVYDAFGRIIQQELPDNTTRNIEYLQSGPIRRILVSSSDGKVEKQEILYETGYNARGQNIYSRLGNGVEIQKEYQPDTFRLSRLLSTRPSTEIPDTSHNLQDITYTYDPVGNLIYYTDNEQMPGAGSLVLTGITVQPHSDFIYDSFYQLKEATGRVHEALGQFDYRRKADMPADVVNAMKGTRHLSLNNGAVVKRYRRTYDYDLSGNIIRIRHRGDTINWTNEKWISVLSNRSLPATDLNSLPLTDPELRFDENGNCLYMPHLRKIEWNYRNNISRVVFVDRSETGGQDNAEYYVYGGDGMRIRKVYENHDTESPRITEKIYLDGCEIKRIHHGSELILERYTSHIEDNTGRIAMIHRWNIDTRTLETDDISKPGFHYQLNNHQGSSSLEVDENCRIISYEEYFPFGRTAFIAGDVAEIDLKDYRYCGKEFDQTGFYYYGYRYYSCWLGNWLSPDPIGPEDALNLYLFVHNNPVNRTDYKGLIDPEDVIIAAEDYYTSGNCAPGMLCTVISPEGQIGLAIGSEEFDEFNYTPMQPGEGTASIIEYADDDVVTAEANRAEANRAEEHRQQRDRHLDQLMDEACGDDDFNDTLLELLMDASTTDEDINALFDSLILGDIPENTEEERALNAQAGNNGQEGNNEQATVGGFFRGLGRGAVTVLSFGSSVDEIRSAYRRGARYSVFEGVLMGIDEFNPFGRAREAAEEGYRRGHDSTERFAYALEGLNEELNPFAIVDEMEEAYQRGHGGFEGTIMALDQANQELNPFTQIGNASSQAYQAVEQGNAQAIGEITGAIATGIVLGAITKRITPRGSSISGRTTNRLNPHHRRNSHHGSTNNIVESSSTPNRTGVNNTPNTHTGDLPNEVNRRRSSTGNVDSNETRMVDINDINDTNEWLRNGAPDPNGTRILNINDINDTNDWLRNNRRGGTPNNPNSPVPAPDPNGTRIVNPNDIVEAERFLNDVDSRPITGPAPLQGEGVRLNNNPWANPSPVNAPITARHPSDFSTVERIGYKIVPYAHIVNDTVAGNEMLSTLVQILGFGG